ncbi:MAG: 1-acyl-sn-glycerol-3-phosphate acyltransferase [Clostridiales bacterium]|jgi:1-acyl-sn-glycerol-3-phosphate acyltransferase|nr:1-acyl-sn-glycerol-3-phosphate acyltransferase [Clostridiales bacterium]
MNNKIQKQNYPPIGVSFFKRAFLTVLGTVLFFALSAFMRSKPDKKKLAKSVKEPCLILSTHGSLFDAAYAGRAISPKYYTGVVAKKLFYVPILGKILKKCGFILKNQFTADINCIKQIKNSIDANVSVFMCPEGKTSVDGRTSYLAPSVAKLIKWTGAPVLFYKPNGSYLSAPRFGKTRRGKINVESRLLFTKEETKTLSADEIFERLNEAFQYNDHEYQEKNHLKFKSRAPASGLENLLYKCPKCGAEFQNVSKKDILECTACGNSVKIDLYGKISPNDGNSVAFDRIDRWVDFQKAALTEEILKSIGENQTGKKEISGISDDAKTDG